ncbi:phosphate acyltransferase [Defluviimonas sp. WL0024]|uniref:Phosphate acyltransferase n=1 Tax=Albidovulum salinarum TaxID=2984153 RepID=A0ABT2X9W6_9RHOB|nr:phosphate acyltransferase [Defluviimonas sp. WL0024]MCU9850430.1 phosphate acyltransferase [Defluviimonas sp. WL0024]
MPVRSFDELRGRARDLGPVRLAVAGGNDASVLEAIIQAVGEGLVSAVQVTGDASAIGAALPAALHPVVQCVEASDAADCATKAVAAVREDRADVLMKGHVDSTAYLRAIVSRDTGIRAGGVLSNVTVAAMPSWPKLIAATDNGILPAPDLDQKRQIVLNTAALFRGLGVSPVKVAAVAATEKVSAALPATVDAAALAKESRAGNLPGFVIDGPFGYDVAVSRDAARAKGLDGSPVAGDADLLLFPTIEAANAVAKSWKFHGQAETGSIVLGARVPVMLNSRSDSAARRINALILAMLARNSGGGTT